jgi:hypothetical protein
MDTLDYWCTTCDNTNPPSNCSNPDKEKDDSKNPVRANPLDPKFSNDLQPSNTDLSSTEGDKGSEQSINEENSGNDFSDLTSQDNSISAEQIEKDESQNQSAQD